jgi:hypothetical protein
MKKEDLISAGISEEIAAFVMSENRNNRALNQEGMEIGDKITIVGISDKPSESVIDGVSRQWVDVLTTGDRNTVSIARLVGTQKRSKYFKEGRNEQKKAYAPEKLLTLPSREGDALTAVIGLVGKTYEVVEIAENCGNFDQTFYLFAEV